jgi:hypothetical protein
MVRTLPDIVGAGATVALTADRSKIANGWVQFVSTGGVVRIGDSLVSVARGIPVPDGSAMFYPVISPQWSDAYVLADSYAYIPVGATLSVSYLE